MFYVDIGMTVFRIQVAEGGGGDEEGIRLYKVGLIENFIIHQVESSPLIDS